jgi:hypothetical protein
MATTAIKTSTHVNEVTRVSTILKFTFGLVPIVAGLDKFTNVLTDWSQYLNPAVANMLPVTAEGFMMIVGVIEIVAGFIVLFRTEPGAYIVSAWLVAIALTLLASGNFLDVAVRDIVMAIGAFCLGRLTHYRNQGGA